MEQKRLKLKSRRLVKSMFVLTKKALLSTGCSDKALLSTGCSNKTLLSTYRVFWQREPPDVWRPFDPHQAPGSETQRNIIQYSTVLRWPGMPIFSLTEIFMRLILLNWCHCLGMHVTAICLFCHCFMKHPTSVFRYQMRVGHSGYKLGDMVVFNFLALVIIWLHTSPYFPTVSVLVPSTKASVCPPVDSAAMCPGHGAGVSTSPSQPSPAQPTTAYTQ